MLINCIKAALISCLLLVCALGSYGAENPRLSCTGNFTNLNQWPVVQFPKRILLVPLLSKNSDSSESERWPERPSAVLEDFYRRRFQAEVVWLRNIHSWDDYYQGLTRLQSQQSAFFDRVIFIGHGGFDGPVLKRTEILQSLAEKNSVGAIVYATEIQPGKQQIFSLTYDASKNKQFSAFVADNWRDLTKMDPDVASERLYEMKQRLQPMDSPCFERYCASLRLLPGEDQSDKNIRMNTCQDICRGPLFTLKAQEEIKPERFFQFASSLNSLTSKDGLVFFGECNPGTPTSASTPGWDNPPGLLVQSELLGGPYKTYVHMLASVSERVAAGPIGESSADDIVQRIIRLETHGHQHRLCIAGPASLEQAQ